MKYRTLGKSELEISEVSFGCMSLKDSLNESIRVLHMAIDSGINYFDTADLYDHGENERLVGKAISGKRQDVVIGTKVGNQWKEDGSGWAWNPSKEYILEAVDESLTRLNTDYIDLYQLHGGTIEDPIDEIIEAFELLIEKGKIRYYGISSIRPNVIREFVAKSNIVGVMMQYSLLDRRPEEKCFELLNQNNIGVLSRGPLAKGLLIDKPAKGYLEFTSTEIKRFQRVLSEVSDQINETSAIPLRFVLNHPAVTSAVVGLRTLPQLRDVLRSINQLIDNEVFARINSEFPLTYYAMHR